MDALRGTICRDDVPERSGKKQPSRAFTRDSLIPKGGGVGAAGVQEAEVVSATCDFETARTGLTFGGTAVLNE
eukprot:1619190-Prymnesium_polylepis.1